jgi:two-component system, cell cycle response regulator
MRVLIAEDSGPSRLVLEKTLRRWGYDVVSCRDGAQAWEELGKRDAPPLAILDWMMPGYSGPELCRMVRERAREPYTYILLLTSRTEREDLIQGLESGADDYITKPFDQSELNVRLRTGLRILDLQSELVQAREALREQAMKDALTGLWNRRSVLEFLEKEQVRARRERSSVALVLLDLDHFKLVNDVHGHLAGDEVLRESARRLSSSVRPYDGVGRYGGEEFLVVLPGCDEDCLRARAEAIRMAFAGGPVYLPNMTLTVTASLGATVFAHDHSTDARDLIRIADEALYRAKSAGRNRTVFDFTPSGGRVEDGVSPMVLPIDTLQRAG